MSLSTKPKTCPHGVFSALSQSVSILAVDDDSFLCVFYREALSQHPLYSVKTASSAQTALKMLQSEKPFHLCILDLGMDDVQDDEFYLLRHFSRKVPFVIISGTPDTERTFEACRIGAREMIAKPFELSSIHFWEKLSKTFLSYTILPDLSEVKPHHKAIYKVLVDKQPRTISQWAMMAGVTDTWLRKVWYEYCDCQPKRVLFLYRLYNLAFDYHNHRQLCEMDEKMLKPRTLKTYSRRMETYLMYQRVFETIKNRKWNAN